MSDGDIGQADVTDEMVEAAAMAYLHSKGGFESAIRAAVGAALAAAHTEDWRSLAAAIMADARRYRWLRNRDNANAALYVEKYAEPEQIDAAIDAAIRARSLPPEDRQ